jgi:hypothetical protein
MNRLIQTILIDTLADDVIELCAEYGKHPFNNVVLTIPNIVRCYDSLECSPIVVFNQTDHRMSSYDYDGVRHVYVKCTVPNTRVSLLANSTSLLSTVVSDPSQWVNFGHFTDYNILHFRLAMLTTMQIVSEYPIHINYEKVYLKKSDYLTSFPFSLPVIYQEMRVDKPISTFVRYMHGMCGSIVLNAANWEILHTYIQDPKVIETPQERNFYRKEQDPMHSESSIQSMHLDEIWNVIVQHGIHPSDEILLSSPPIGSCECDNSQKDLLKSIVFEIDPNARVSFQPIQLDIFDESLKQRELIRCEKINVEYNQLLHLIKSRMNYAPLIQYSV